MWTVAVSMPVCLAGPLPAGAGPRAMVPTYGVSDLGLLLVVDMNARADVLGDLPTDAGTSRALRWSGGRFTDLGTFGGDDTVPFALADNGDAVGYSRLPSGTPHAFRWRAGVLTDLGTLGGFSGARAINSHGDIVGSSRLASGAEHAVRWRHGVMTDLGAPRGGKSVAVDINDRGDILVLTGTRSYRWRDGVFTELRTPDGKAVQAFRINARGTVLGWPFGSGPDPHWYVWIGNSAVDTGLNLSSTASLNDLDQVSGSRRIGADWYPVLWQHGVMTVLPLPPGMANSRAESLNNRGQIVGWSWPVGGQIQAALWDHGRPVLLPSPGFTTTDAFRITDSGVIVGIGTRAGGGQSTVLWRPADAWTPRLPPGPASRGSGGPA